MNVNSLLQIVLLGKSFLIAFSTSVTMVFKFWIKKAKSLALLPFGPFVCLDCISCDWLPSCLQTELANWTDNSKLLVKLLDLFMTSREHLCIPTVNTDVWE